MHIDTPGQDTQNNCPVGATGFGLGTFDQPDPGALAPAGAASTVAARAADAMTAKMTRSRTVRMGPPFVTREPTLPSWSPASVLLSWHGVNSRAASPRQGAELTALMIESPRSAGRATIGAPRFPQLTLGSTPSVGTLWVNCGSRFRGGRAGSEPVASAWRCVALPACHLLLILRPAGS